MDLTSYGIHVEDSDTDGEEWEVMREWFWRYIDQAEDKHFVRFVIPKQKSKLALPSS